MNNIKYFFQFIFIIFLFLIFKLLGLKYSQVLSGTLLSIIGPIFRSNEISNSNLSKAFPNMENSKKQIIINKMWFNYGRIFAEYMFLKNFRISEKFNQKIIVKNQGVLEKIKENSEPIIFKSISKNFIFI